MQGLLAPQAVAEMPAVAQWLKYGEACVQRAKSRLPDAAPDDLLRAVIEQNVLLQIEHLQGIPAVKEAAAAGRLRLHGWVYEFENGGVTAYDPDGDRFVPLSESPRQKLLVPIASNEPGLADPNM